MKILLVEDEPKLSEFVSRGLTESGYDVEVAYDGQIGKVLALRNQYDLLILDIIVPFINGVELCKRVREHNKNVPILMLTALGTTEDKVTGLDAGADDYLVKPFEFKELLARVRSLTRRATPTSKVGEKLKYADLELDTGKKMASRQGKTITLTAKEYGLLELFISNPGRVLSRVEIAEKVWDINFDTGTNVVDVYINTLRKKIDKDFDTKLIHTRVGLGYIMEASA